MASNPPPPPQRQAPPLQGRPVGGTERSWCKAVPGGTGITTLAFLLSPSPSPSSLLDALHQLQRHSFPLLRSTLSSSFSSSSSSNLISFSISPHPSLQFHSRVVLPPGDDNNPSPPPLHLALRHELNLNPWRDHPDSSDLLYVTVYSLPDHSAILVLRIHTAIADRTSAFAIASRLIGLLGGSHDPPGGTATTAMMTECVEELIPFHHKKKAFWTRGKDMLGYSLNFSRSSHLPFADARGHRSTDLVMLELTVPETTKLLAGCKERGIKLCGALTAAVLIAAASYKHHSINKSETYCTITQVDCRKCLCKPLTDHDIGFYHSAIQNLHTVKTGEGLWDVAVRCYNSFSSALKGNKHITDVDDLNFLMLRAIQAPQLTPSSSLRTALVSVFEEPVVYDTAELYQGTCVKDYLGCSSVHGVGPSIALFDTIRDGQLSCACLYPSPLHSREQMLELVDSMKGLILVAINPSN